MSNINNQDLYSIELVQDLDHEAAASVSGGTLYISKGYNDTGDDIGLSKGYTDLGSYKNKVSWYKVTGYKNWYAYTGKNYTGKKYTLYAGTKGNLSGNADNNIESVLPA